MMTDQPFRYSTDQDFKSRLESFEDEHPDFDTDGLTDWQKEMLLVQADEALIAAGISINDAEIFGEAATISDKPSEATVSDTKPEGSTSLTTSEMRSLLVANGVPVGKRGRLSPDQIAKAHSLSK